VYTDYRDAARHMLVSGVPNDAVSGPDLTAINLFFRDRSRPDPHNASFWASDLVPTRYVCRFLVRMVYACTPLPTTLEPSLDTRYLRKQ
jgi:hypothetical protein